MDLSQLRDVLSSTRSLCREAGCRFRRRRRWTPFLVVYGLLAMAGDRSLSSIEHLMESMAEWMDWDDVPSDSTFVEARQALHKLRPTMLRDLWKELSVRAVDWIPKARRTLSEYQVVAVDGSWAWLPRAAGLVKRFGRPKGANGTLLHYPQALLVTALDVLTRVPVAIGVTRHDGAERELLKGFLEAFHAGMIALFDRGFPAHELLWKLTERRADIVWRMGTADANSWTCVYDFLHDPARPKDALATVKIPPSKGGGKARTIRVRLIRRTFRRGRPKKSQKRETMVLMTTLLDETVWPAERLLALYERRWVIEEWFGDLKVHFGLEAFHSTTADGIEQEIYALMAWVTICGIVEQHAYHRIERSRGKQDPEDPLRFQVSRVNLYKISAKLLGRILRGMHIDHAITSCERSLEWLSKTARRRRPGRSSPRARKFPHGRWNG